MHSGASSRHLSPKAVLPCPPPAPPHPRAESLPGTPVLSSCYTRFPESHRPAPKPTGCEPREPRTYVVHVLAEQVLERLPDGVALGHDPLAPVVARAGRVGHERRAADDALQSLLERRPEPGLAERHGVQDYLILKAAP